VLCAIVPLKWPSTSDPFQSHALAGLAIGATVAMLIVEFFSWIYADEADWFAQQLERLRARAAVNEAATRR
jgi:hypothetical protein